MPISIGGSPGTGSSLLRQMLNRHPDIYCGPETNVFAFPALFEDWKKNSQKLAGVRRTVRNKLVAPSIRMIHRTRLAGSEQCWAVPEVRELILGSASFKEFCGDYFTRPCQVYGKSLWAEKTPANVLTFHKFLRTWDDGIVVHMIRHPLDTIASLLDRGIPLFEATARYLFNCAFALQSGRDGRHLTIRYEDLVEDAGKALGALIDICQLSYNPDMVGTGNPAMDETDQLDGWRFSETDHPRTGSVGRFEQAAEDVQRAILAAISVVQINPDFAQVHGLEVLKIEDVAEKMGYNLLGMRLECEIAFHEQLRRQEKTYRRMRLLKNNWWYEKNRPLVITNVST